jgi:hypothetical protein
MTVTRLHLSHYGAAINCRTVAAAAVLLACAIRASAADQPTAKAEKAEDPAAKIRRVIDDVLGWHEVFPAADSDEPLTVIPALRWSNNTRGTENAMTVLYVTKGRPYAAACLFPYDKGMIHDLQSLARAEDKINARRDGKVVWEPNRAGVEFAPIPDAPPAEESRPARLRQIKQLSERFQSSMLGWKHDSNDQEQLRLLTKPLYRYDPESGPVVDGAVFAFVQGTDPESLLLIELVEEDGERRWEYAFARRTAGKLEGRLDGKVVWAAPLNPEYKDPRGPHFTVHLELGRSDKSP